MQFTGASAASSAASIPNPSESRPWPTHIESLARYGELVEHEVQALIARKIATAPISEDTRAQLTRSARDLLKVFQRAFSTYMNEYHALFMSRAVGHEGRFREDERALATCTDDAMKLLHAIGRDLGSASDSDSRAMVEKLTQASGRMRALKVAQPYLLKSDAYNVLATRGAKTTANMRNGLAWLTGTSLIHLANRYPERAFVRPERLRRELDLCGWDPSKAKPGAVYVIAGNADSSLYNAFTASRIARRMNVDDPVFEASDIPSARAAVLAKPSNQTVMATVGVAEDTPTNYAHFPRAARTDSFELGRELAQHYGSGREVFLVEAISNGVEHRTKVDAPPLTTKLSEPERVDPAATEEWVAGKRAAFESACDANQKIVNLADPAFAKGTSWPLAVGAATAIGHRPDLSMLGSIFTTIGITKTLAPPFEVTDEASRTLISSYGHDRKASGAATLVTAEEQAAYEGFNAHLAKKYPDLAFMLGDPEEFLATMRARYAAQKALTPEEPYNFDYSEIGLPVVRDIVRSLDERVTALDATLKTTTSAKTRADLELGLKLYRELCAESAGYLTNNAISYRELQELSFFFSRAIGHFDIKGVSAYKRALLSIDRGQQGYEPLPLEQEYQHYREHKFSIFQKPTYVNGFKTVQSWLEKQFAKTDELTMLTVPTVADLGTDIFHRLAWYPIHMMGVAVKGPIPADGFLRPGGDFWNHDMRHASIILSEMVRYVDKHKLTPQQLEKLRKASDIWYENYRARLKDVHDPKLKRAIQMTYFNLHHEQGYPLAASSYAEAHNGLFLSKALGKILLISGQTDKYKGGSFKEVEHAYEWLVDFWRNFEAQEKQILA